MSTHGKAALVLILALGACARVATPVSSGPVADRVVRVTGSYEMQMTLNRADAVFTDTLALDPGRAWAALPVVYDFLGLPVHTTNPGLKELGVVAHQPRRIEGQRLSTFLDCGISPAGSSYADSYQVYFWMTSRVIPRASGSRVQTTVQANARPRDTSGEPLPCASRGRLERRVVELLQQRTAGSDG
ncbi:MAG: hypothetical protein EXR95_05615 [Gemmatimonadetes bacterium]|nr:hypothetical protein [Gemmatimonadota bacterium]